MINKRELRYAFPVTRNCVYFNHAAVGSLGRHSYEAMEACARDQRDFGAVHWREWLAHYARFRNAAAGLIGAEPGEISILKNTTEGLSFVAEGLEWKAGDNVVTTDMEFPSNLLPWRNLARRGVECRQIRNRDGVFSAADVDALIDSRTRVVALSLVSFHNGFRPDIEAIGELCESRGVLLCVDAIQGLGALQLDVKKARISFLSADGHKWLLGPEGLAMFYCAAELRDRLTPLENGWMSVGRGGTSIAGPHELHADGRRFEGGAINTVGVCGLHASISFLTTIGIAEIEAEVIRLATLLGDRLAAAGYHVRSPQPISSGIVSVTPPEGVDLSGIHRELRGSAAAPSEPAEGVRLLHAWLESHGVICSAREGMLRFSPHFYNDDSEIDRVAELLSSVA